MSKNRRGKYPQKYSWKWVDDTTITRQMIANLLNIFLRQVDNFINADGCPLDDFGAFLEWYHTIDFMIYDEEGAGWTLNQLKQIKLNHDTRKAKHDANRSEIAEERARHLLEVDQSVYVERDVVLSRITDISKRFGERLFAFPNRVVKALMVATTEQEMKEIMDSEFWKLTWEVNTRKYLKHLTMHEVRTNSVRFSANGETIASGSYDQTVRVWSANSGKHLKTLSGHTSRVSSVAFSLDGKTLASGSSDGTILLWDVP